jgi:hypothetical protein
MLNFKQETFYSRIVSPTGETAQRPVEIRTHPITGRTCRITYSRSEEREPGTEALPAPPPFAGQQNLCPFCRVRLAGHTPRLSPDLYPAVKKHILQKLLMNCLDLQKMSLSLKRLLRFRFLILPKAVNAGGDVKGFNHYHAFKQ